MVNDENVIQMILEVDISTEHVTCITGVMKILFLMLGGVSKVTRFPSTFIMI